MITRTGIFCAAFTILTALSACAPEQSDVDQAPQAEALVDTTVATADTRIETRLEERPDIFAVRDLGLWDGRPSLGGPWVAHPDVTNAERVEITNLANNVVTTAALFRRERAMPGPAFQLSAETAIALAVPAGVPTQLSVVAIREGIVETPVEPAEDTVIVETVTPPAPASDPASEPVEVAETPDPVVSAAAIEAVEDPATPTAVTSNANVPERPFMQVGMFGVASNADALVARLQAEGLPASSRPAGSLSRVVVGPAASAQELAAFRDRLRALGFTDSLAISLE